MKESNNWNGKHILISRTDSIGDVLLTLPMTAWLKTNYPQCKITFLCRNYTAPIVEKYQAVDTVVILDELQQETAEGQVKRIQSLAIDAVIHVFPRKELARLFKKARVSERIGTSHRLFHFLTCNIRPNFTRKNSPLHESQLNFELLRPFGLTMLPSLTELNTFTAQLHPIPQEFPSELNIPKEPEIICLHPKSQGSAREWPMENYLALARLLLESGKTVCFTGTEKEGLLFRDQLPQHPRCIDTTGKLSIDQLLWLIHESYGLVACSTGPLHIAGFMGIRAVGLFSPKVPIHPGRWKPLGEHSIALVFDEKCAVCAANKPCDCIERITAQHVFESLSVRT